MRVILIVTDAAAYTAYMVAAFKNLKNSLLLQLIHVTYIVHDNYRVCKIIREENVEVNRFVSLLKKLLLKFEERKNLHFPFP